MAMPAMSPTMTEGGISKWKVEEGGSFAAGDVLLEIVRSQINFIQPPAEQTLTLRAGDGQGGD